MRELDFVPNRAARGLITGRTDNVAVIVPDITNPTFAALVRAAGRAAREADLQLLLVDTGEHAEEEVRAARTLSRRSTGSWSCRPAACTGSWAPWGRPLRSSSTDRCRGRASVVIRTARAVDEAVRHLVGHGHGGLAYLGGPKGSWAASERRDAVRRTSRDTGIAVHEITVGAPTFEAAASSVDAIVASGATAVLAFNGQMALGVIAGLAQRGIAVPGDVSVVGGDDVPMAAMTAPPLDRDLGAHRGGGGDGRRAPAQRRSQCRAGGDPVGAGLDAARSRAEVGPPAATQVVRGGLRVPVAGEHALLVAVDPHERLPRVAKSAKFQTCSPTTASMRSKTRWYVSSSSAWYSSLHGTDRRACSPAIVSAPYSVTMIGLSCLSAHARSSASSPRSAAVEVAGVDVPAVVAVDHHHVGELGQRGSDRGGASIMLTKPDGPGRVGLPGGGEQRLEVGARLLACGTRARWRCSRARRSGGSCRGRRARDRLAVDLLGGVVDRVRREKVVRVPRRRRSRRPTPRFRPTAAVSSMTTMPSRSAWSSTSSA